MWTRARCALVIALVVAGPSQAVADEQALEAALSDAKMEVEAGRCEQARARLAAFEGLADRSALLFGLCSVRAGRYPEALSTLDGVRGASGLSSTQLGDVELYRGVALYHLERYVEAGTALEAADGLTSESAELALYRGLIALRAGDSGAAAPDLENAALLAPAATEPVASYYAGLAWQGANQREKARAAFERVVALDGEDGPWGRQARELLGQTAPHPFFLRASAGLEYDDNVILRGGATQFTSPDAPATRAGEKDGRAVWSIDGGVQLFERGALGAGVTAGYSGSAHFDLEAFDVQYPRAGAYLVERFGPDTTGQLRYEIGAAWVDEDPFLHTQLVEGGLSHTWERAGTTVFVVDYVWNDLRFENEDVLDGPGAIGGECVPGAGSAPRCGPVGLDEGRARDRDGSGVGAAVEQRHRIAMPEGVSGLIEALRLTGGYRYRAYLSQGSEWRHMSHILTAGLDFELPFATRLGTRASYELRDFANPSTFPDRETVDQQYALSSRDRREHEVGFMAELEKKLVAGLSVGARWSYLDNESNRRVYDYTRHVVGAYLNWQFE